MLYIPVVNYKNQNGKDASMDVISRLLSLGVIFISEEITQPLVALFTACVYHLVYDLNFNKITIILNSYGGDAYTGIAISDIIRYCFSNIKFETYCVGFAGSAASVIFVSGHIRKMTKYSRLMLHQPSTTLKGNAREVKANAQELLTLEAVLIDLYARFTRHKEIYTAEYFRQAITNDAFFSADEAMTLGLTDIILQDDSLGSTLDNITSRI